MSCYDFEIDRVVAYIQDSKSVGLQFPEGLMKFATHISEEIMQRLD